MKNSRPPTPHPNPINVPSSNTQVAHEDSITAIQFDLGMPGYHVGFFVQHKKRIDAWEAQEALRAKEALKVKDKEKDKENDLEAEEPHSHHDLVPDSSITFPGK